MLVRCEVGELAWVRCSVREWLEEAEVPAGLREAILLGTHEAAAGAIERAGRSGWLMVLGWVDRATLKIDVTSSGTAPDKGTVGEEARGRLIRGLVEHVELRRGIDSTTLELRQPL